MKKFHQMFHHGCLIWQSNTLFSCSQRNFPNVLCTVDFLQLKMPIVFIHFHISITSPCLWLSICLALYVYTLRAHRPQPSALMYPGDHDDGSVVQQSVVKRCPINKKHALRSYCSSGGHVSPSYAPVVIMMVFLTLFCFLYDVNFEHTVT